MRIRQQETALHGHASIAAFVRAAASASRIRFVLRITNGNLLVVAKALVLGLVLLLPSLPVAGQEIETFFNRNTPVACQEKMALYKSLGDKILCVAYRPGGGWSVITDRRFFNSPGIPQACHNEMWALKNAGHKIMSVAYPPAGGDRWSIITDRGFFSRNIPLECEEKMRIYRDSGDRLLCVAFPPIGGNSFSVITDRRFFNSPGVPQECHDRMWLLKNAGHQVRSVAFPPAGGNRWSVTTDRGFYNRRGPSECHRVMRAMTRCPGGPLRQVAFDPDGDGFTVLSDISPLGRPDPVITRGNNVFSLDKFADDLKQTLDNAGLVKYGFVIRHGSTIRSHATGLKRKATGSTPAQDFTIYDRFNPASVSKLITATAVVRAAQNAGVSLNTSIAGYLPSFWNVHSSVDQITIKDLLSHKSGFRTGGLFYNDLKSMVAAGVRDEDYGVFAYNGGPGNLNYALARIVCAYLAGYTEPPPINFLGYYNIPGDYWAGSQRTSDYFIDFVQRYLMDPCLIPNVAWRPDAVEPTLFYPNPPGSSAGNDYGDFSLRPGSAGVHLSLAELAIFLDQLANTSSILSSAMRDEMEELAGNNNLLGWDQWFQTASDGVCISKGGLFPARRNVQCEIRCRVVKFESGVQLVLVTNGTIGLPWRTEYDGAWSPISLSITQRTPTLANVTSDSIMVTGSNLQLTTRVDFGPHVIRSTDASDPTQPYFRVLSSTRMEVHPPQGLVPNRYALRLSGSSVQSNSVDVTLTRPAQPTILVTPEVAAGENYNLVLSSGNLGGVYMWASVSSSRIPSVYSGLFSIDIGAGFSDLTSLGYFWPNEATGARQVTWPSVAFMTHGAYFQAVYLTPGAPWPTSDVATLLYR